eukprot:167817_1
MENSDDYKEQKDESESNLWSKSNRYWMSQTFVNNIKLFWDFQVCMPNEPKMSLFEFLFFKCGYHEIANYAAVYGYKSKVFKVLKMEGTDFFIKDENNRIHGVDRRQKLCSTYLPTACRIRITYKHSNNKTVSKSFSKEKTMQMVIDTNLILQGIIDDEQICELRQKYSKQKKQKEQKVG